MQNQNNLVKMAKLSKEFIEKLSQQNSDYTSPESAQNLANSLESLSKDIYTDSQRFVYELLQNADDASSTYGSLELAIKIVDQYLVVSHNGEPFTQVDIESICSVGDGNKRGDANKTGFKGIGFKSVFSHSDLVIINSGNYCFRFDKGHWDGYWKDNWGIKEDWEAERVRKQKQKNIKMPWQIIPIWTDLPQKLITTKSNVSTIIRYQDTEKLQKDLFELFSNTQILLFLRSKQIKITISKNSLTFAIEKITQNGVVILIKNSQKVSEWLLRTFEIPVDDSTKSLMENDVRIPQKLRQSNKTELSFAVQIENDQIKIPDKESSLIFTYLPTSVNYNFPFLVNASFLTDAGRQHLHEDLPWNSWLFRKMPIMLLIWLSGLAKSEYNNQVLKLIPYELYNSSRLKSSFNAGLKTAIDKIAFIPNEQGQLLKVSEAIFDKTKISDFVGRKVLVNYINSINNTHFDESAFIPRLEPIRTLKNLGLMIFDIDSLESFLRSTTFQDNHHIEQNFDLISYLYEQSEHHLSGQEKEEWIYKWIYKLKSIPFIFDQFEHLKTPQQIYFPNAEFSDEFNGETISIIHSEIVEQMESNSHIRDWLESLGVKEPTDIAFIEKTIIEDEDYITVENAIKVGRYLFSAHKKGLLTENLYAALKEINLLSTKNTLIAAQDSFLSNFYEPQLKLENICVDGIFVSDSYYFSSSLVIEWKSFFIKIGVSENIRVNEIRSNRNETQLIEHEYFDLVSDEAKRQATQQNYHPHLVTKNNDVTFNRIAYTKLAKNYNFSKLFWRQVFVYVNPTQVPQYGLLHWGYYGSNWKVANYFHWAIENLEIIPTTMGRCFNGKNVFANSKEIKEIGGKYLPIFDHEGVIPQNWLEYLPFKSSLRLDDYLDILSLISQEKSNDQDLIKENQKRIKTIYQKLADDYLNYVEKLEQWGKNNTILSENEKSFFKPSELSVITVEGFKGQKLAFCDERNEKVIELLKIFGVSVITEINLDVHGQFERQDLKKKIKEVLPLIAVVSVKKSKNKKDWQTEYNRLYQKLTEASFFEASEIYLSYDNSEEKQLRSSWAKDNNFYYVGDWKKPRVLDGIVETLGRFLGVRHEERHLSILLSDTFEEGVIYLKEKFGDIAIDLIPSEYYSLELADPNISVFNPSKTPSTAFHCDDGVSEKELANEYGTQGEYWAKKFYTYLGYQVSQANEDGYDLLCQKDHESIKVEVKAITFSRPNIRLTKQEWGQMMNSSNINSYEIFVFSHNKGNLQELIRCREAWLTLQSVLTKLHSQSKSNYYYGTNEVELLLGLQLNQSESGNDVIINWHRLIKNSNQKSIEKYKYDETVSIFVKTA
ncbi:MAG: DUF3883 domain-containing protein [Microcystis sp. Msp_OC_L_20101000_S702]|uniref:sacsin N-terminal ATP-binding-like domain-containing protein n=1 Tax=Microcystis sp. Msp_OC_L_20101000_S702 TaxID=2486218 RepID=UPI0011906DA0|nr:DUF3883 domain-containing protein [Microcystis sp. Msp_OC_L_20101000_S702]TRU05941.1 MAG: DUF3883 domain-containing protein [Microcystis sp. Msp_OC_L_20101000_S702]